MVKELRAALEEESVMVMGQLCQPIDVGGIIDGLPMAGDAVKFHHKGIEHDGIVSRVIFGNGMLNNRFYKIFVSGENDPLRGKIMDVWHPDISYWDGIDG